MRRRRSALLAIVAVVGAVGAAAGCGTNEAATVAPSALRDDAITVASFDFAESELLAELYSQALEGGGMDVRRAFQLGSRELVLPALAEGLVELVPEYAGSTLAFVSLGEELAGSDSARTHDRLVDLLADSPVRALRPARATDANALVVTRATAERQGLRTLSDVGPVAATLTFGGPPECASRPHCLLGLERVYGIRFREVLTLDAGGPLTRQALRNGDVDIALLFSTDPAVADFVELVDDRHLQPAENITPLVRAEVAERWGRPLIERLNEVSDRLTTEALRTLNAAVASGETNAKATASAWLEAEGIR